VSGSDVRQVPAMPSGAGHERHLWPWMVGGGCVLGCVVIGVLIVVLAIGGLNLGAQSLKNRLQHGGFSCLQSDFPLYPGSTFGGENFDLNESTPGNACQMVYQTNDSAASVIDFYTARLDSGDWQVTSSDSVNGQLAFSSKRLSTTHGTLTVAQKNDHAIITIVLYSA
jgi:hypothetical protein